MESQFFLVIVLHSRRSFIAHQPALVITGFHLKITFRILSINVLLKCFPDFHPDMDIRVSCLLRDLPKQCFFFRLTLFHAATREFVITAVGLYHKDFILIMDHAADCGSLIDMYRCLRQLVHDKL